MGATLLVVVGLAVRISVGSELQLNNVIIAILVGIWILSAASRNLRSRGRPGELVVAATFLFLGITTMTLLGAKLDGPSEITRVTLVLVGAVAVRQLFGAGLWHVLPWFGVAATASVLLAVLTGALVDRNDGRLWIENAGSSNPLGFMCAVAALILVFSQPAGVLPGPYKLVRWPAFTAAFAMMLMTQSRGGFFAFAVGLAVGLVAQWREHRRRAWIGLVALALGAILVGGTSFASGLLDRLGSGGQNITTGRTTIWRYLLERVFDSPSTLLLGLGPGTGELFLFNSFTRINAAHSILVMAVYSYGIFGAIALIALLLRRWRNAWELTVGHRALRISLMAALTLSFTVDSVVLASGNLLLVAVALGTVGMPGGHYQIGGKRCGRDGLNSGMEHGAAECDYAAALEEVR